MHPQDLVEVSDQQNAALDLQTADLEVITDSLLLIQKACGRIREVLIQAHVSCSLRCGLAAPTQHEPDHSEPPPRSDSGPR